jgi:transcriptional regulator with XRE-family HTH domain
MTIAPPSGRRTSQVGALLQHWRRLRHMSQLALAYEARVSPRHVSFVETGRAQPSREMVLTLAGALNVPLREQNALLLAAGYAPLHRETRLDAPELDVVRVALDAILRQQEPYPAVVMNRRWDVLLTNAGATRFFSHLLGPAGDDSPMNVVRLMFDPAGLKPFVTNWDAVAESLVRRVQREAVGGVPDEATLALLDEVFSLPGVPAQWSAPNAETAALPVIPVAFTKDGLTFDFFSAVTTLGTPQDITLQELRIECFFPMDEATRRNVAALELEAAGE